MSAFSLDGKLALVTGASRGIGRGIALELAAAGAAVICLARSDDELPGVADEIEAAGGEAWAWSCDCEKRRRFSV